MGYTRIDNAIIDHTKDLSGRELKILLIIQRQTRGWNRLSACIPPSRFSKLTGIRIDHCVNILNNLETRNMVHRIKEDKEHRYFPSIHTKIGYQKRKNLPF